MPPWNLKVQVTGLDSLQFYMKKLEKQFPGISQPIMEDFGNTTVGELRRELIIKNLVASGYLYNNVKYWIKDNYMEVTVPEYGVALDFNSGGFGHFTEIKKSRVRLLRWIFMKGNAKLQKRAENVLAGKGRAGIWFRPHPWISNPLDRSIDKLPTIVERQVDKILKQ